ncbi:hypothetical protein QVD17_12469 [Tagetes erecta]|uniref:Uncharacterized protein n=1 Tax=Tagetes erecta TaxID=13708 RepID=A0AAD8P2V0_TARER|nr:hypothetical protein QVD17_12469 [Tagetes erecta]
MKIMKTLKFWSKKKKKKNKRISNIHHHHSPPPCCCCSHIHHHDTRTFQPSAPPLPSWFDYEEQTYNQHLLTSQVKSSEFSGLPVSYEAQFDPQEHDNNPSPATASGDVETGCSYQQYMVENPVYGASILPSRKAERSAGAVGCVVSVGAHLFRCFFPCFHIRDAQTKFGF